MVENYIKKEVRDSLGDDLNDRRRARDDANDYNRYQDEEDGVAFDPDVSYLFVRVYRCVCDSGGCI